MTSRRSVLGLDLAADPKRTGGVILHTDDGRSWRALVLDEVLTDDVLVHLATTVDSIGVDAPLGWPVDFVEAVRAHHALEAWPAGTDRSRLTHRDTDRLTRPYTGRLPLSVSADLLGSVAFRCALLQRRWADEVWGSSALRDGAGPLKETYPKAAFDQWGLDSRRYKAADRRAARAVRSALVADLDRHATRLDIADIADACIESHDVLDALACALIAIAAGNGATVRPTAEQRPTALVEGWIHVPVRPLDEFPWDPLDAR